jgi:hypothetical protein
MPNWSDADLKRQFGAAKAGGWISFFEKASQDYLFPVEVLLGIASRETNMKSIVGDGGHGYGVMQIDDRSFPDWCHSGGWKDINACIQKGALVLDSKREQIRSGQGATLRIGGASFRGAPNLTDDNLLRIAIAAYNSGLWSYYDFSKSGDPDQRTTGHDYSRDVLARTSIFRTLIAA